MGQGRSISWNDSKRRAQVAAFALFGVLLATVGSSPSGALATSLPTSTRTETYVVQFNAGVSLDAAKTAVNGVGGQLVGELPLITGLAANLTDTAAAALRLVGDVKAVTPNVPVLGASVDTRRLATTYNQAVESPDAWERLGATGKGVAVAVIDSGVAGGMPDFQVSQSDTRSRVIASVVVNPYATSARDTVGHGTHVAGIIAGNSLNRPTSDPAYGKYIGTAPHANLVSVKVDDDEGAASVLDVLYGLQFVVDHKDVYNIRVVNLSLESGVAQSYREDPLAAAVESAWLKGLVVVAAAGNRGAAADAAHYAPSNDPFVISVGALDDRGTRQASDDVLASWSSRGVTQDGFAKPEIVAPARRVASTLAPHSSYTTACPSCVVDGSYIHAGGTSMAAPMVAGVAAGLLERHPTWTPNMLKGVLVHASRSVPGDFLVPQAYAAGIYNDATAADVEANKGLQTNTSVDESTGEINDSPSSWSRSSWSTASGSLSADWARSSWSCTCGKDDSGEVVTTRSSWSRSSWSRSSWSAIWE